MTMQEKKVEDVMILMNKKKPRRGDRDANVVSLMMNVARVKVEDVDDVFCVILILETRRSNCRRLREFSPSPFNSVKLLDSRGGEVTFYNR